MLYWPQRAERPKGRAADSRGSSYLPGKKRRAFPPRERWSGMLTAMLALSQLRGAQLWLVFWLALAALYFALMLGVPPLRKKAGAKNVLLAFLAAEAFTDLVWAGVYGYQPVYRNYGVAAVYGLALWPVALAAAAAAALVWGKRNSSKKEKSLMWSEKNSLSLSRLAVLLFTGAVAVCDVSGWWLVNWFLRTSRYAGINDAAHLVWGLVTLYVASAAAYVLLWNLYRLLVNIEEEQVFVADNVHHLRAASWCCMAVALLCLGGAVFYLPMVMVAAAAAFMGLIVRIIKNVFQRAIGMKAELDLTI